MFHVLQYSCYTMLNVTVKAMFERLERPGQGSTGRTPVTTAVAPSPTAPQSRKSGRLAPPAPSFEEIPLLRGRVDLARGEVRHSDGSRCELSERETELLRYLASNAGRVVSRDEILDRVWHLDPQRIITRTIDMHVAHLRGKLGDNAERPRVLRTVHGYGYMFSADGTGEA
jgi:DNA-binding response OmpR family regulator